jgi:hypothetical protein
MLASSSALRAAAAGLGTLLLLLVVQAVAGPGLCATPAICRVDADEPTGCAPPPPCDGPGPSLQTALAVALLVGLAVALAGLLQNRGRRA